jgi:hypothetical protein
MTKRSSHLVTCFSLAALFAVPLPAQSQAGSSAPLLDRTGQRVKQFWDELTSVACNESLLQEKLDPKGRVLLNYKANFDYLITLRSDNAGMLIDESRLPVGQQQKKAPQGVLLTTQGFATLLMVFHPEFQPGFTFSLDGTEEIGGRTVARVQFVPRKGAPSPAMLSLKGREYPIAWEGTAWIEPETGMISRIDAHWKDPAEEIGLEALSSEVRYAPMSFKGGQQSFWLPQTAKIEVKTAHQHWRNTHQFSSYRLFSVESEQRIGDVKQDGKPSGKPADANDKKQ